MEISLTDKLVMVTGSARRVGKQIALAFAHQGCHVVIHHSNSDSDAEATAQEIRDLGRQALVVKGDHSTYSTIEANFEQIKTHFDHLDILVNSAGVFPATPFLDIPPDEWQQTVNLNLSAPFWATQLAARWMRDQQIAGCIINIGDNAGFRPWVKRPHHSITKAGVTMLTEVAAKSLAPYQIRVNCVVPGPVLPPPDMDPNYWADVVKRIPLGRDGDPDDVARAAVFIAKNDFMTGAILRVDGGEYLG